MAALVPRLSGDAERARIHRARDPLLARLRDRLVGMATARERRGSLPTGVRWWIKYTIYGRGVAPVRLVDEHAPRHLKLEEETLLMDFVVWLVACAPSGKSISVKTAMKYVSEVQAWSSRLPVGGGRIGGGLELAGVFAISVEASVGGGGVSAGASVIFDTRDPDALTFAVRRCRLNTSG